MAKKNGAQPQPNSDSTGETMESATRAPRSKRGAKPTSGAQVDTRLKALAAFFAAKRSDTDEARREGRKYTTPKQLEAATWRGFETIAQEFGLTIEEATAQAIKAYVVTE